MTNPLFSTYRAGENRVTSSTIAVFERIDLALVRELLQSATGMGDELQSVAFENQVVGEGSVPDARISARFTWWFETKTYANGYASEGHDRQQLRAHAVRLADDADARLFVLTPDAAQPSWFDDLEGIDANVRPRIVWFSFAQLSTVIREVLAEPTRLIGEQSRFLLAELVALYEADGLLSHDDTVVVAARNAWGDYLEHSAYVYQPNRAFRTGLTHLGFYRNGQIMTSVPQILKQVRAIVFSAESAARLREAGEGQLAGLIEVFLERGLRDDGESYGVMLLSPADDARTLGLSQPIVNDTRTANGRPWAWTLGQRYTQAAKLTSGARYTSEL